jgi:iron complex transport system permease protein
VLRSTLADPYTLGVSSGAMFGAASASALATGVPAFAGAVVVALPAGATVGALGAAALAVALARVGGDVAPGRLLLVGAALSSLSASLTGLLLAIAPEAARVRSLVLWLLGGLHAPSWSGVAWTAGAAIAGGLVAWRLSRALDVLLLGEVEARALGLDVDRVRGGLVLLAAALTGVAVAYSGAIGFVGLAVPHVARRWLGAAHGPLVVGAALLGAASLVALDAIARTVIAPEELPVGVLAGALGAPFFLLVLRGDPRHGRGGIHAG